MPDTMDVGRGIRLGCIACVYAGMHTHIRGSVRPCEASMLVCYQSISYIIGFCK